MLLVVIAIIVAIVLYVRNEQKKNLQRQWELAAEQLENLRCIPGGALSRNPSLCGLVEGRRIDIAPFVHQEYGNSTKKMTGYRVRRDSPVDMPDAAIASLTNHFHRFEIDDRRIFCATDGVEESSIALVTGVQKIIRALQLADIEHERLSKELLDESRAQIESEVKETRNRPGEPPPPLEPQEPVEAVLAVEIPPGTPEDEIPTIVRLQEASQPTEDSPATQPPEPAAAPSNGEATDENSETDAVDEAETTLEPAPAPAPSPQHDPSLTHAARDLFDAGRNRFEITQRFDAEYADREVTSHGVLRRIDTFANDRTFGRGPGIIAEVEVYRPEPQIHDDDEAPRATGAVSVSSVTANIELLAGDDSTPASRARSWRERIGDDVELCGTLVRCDAFEARLYVKQGILA